MTNEQKALEEACTRARIEKIKSLDGVEVLFFNGKDYSSGYYDGAMYILEQIENEISFCAENQCEYPIIHLLDFIDRTRGRRK